MYSTTTRHTQKVSVAYRLIVPKHPVMQVAPDPHPPTPPSGATVLASKCAPTAAIRHRLHSGTASKQELMPGAGIESLDLLTDRIGVRLSYEPKARIFYENDPATKIYKVVRGSVRTCKFLRDGRRLVGGFYFPGDYFGFGFADRCTLSAEAVTSAKVLVVRKSVLAAVVNHDAALKQELLSLATLELARLQERMTLLIKNAHERVGEFILEMEKRGKVGDFIQLPMKRQDIADYLGLKIETVSRILTSLESCAAIEMPTSRRIVLRSRAVLKTLMADRSKLVLSNPHSVSNNTRKRLNRRHRVERRAPKKAGILVKVGGADLKRFRGQPIAELSD